MNKTLPILLPLFMLGAPVSVAQTNKPAAAQMPIPGDIRFTPGQIWKDNNGVHINAHGGGILFNHKNNTYYWYGEHKVEGDAGNYAQVGVHCYSSKDLTHWKDEGIALKVVEGDDSHPIAKGCILERPKVVFNKKTGKYVMWFHLELKGKGYGAAYAGCAVADSPTGPFTFKHAGRVNPGKWAANIDKKDRHTDNVKVPHLTSSALPQDADPLGIFKRDFKDGQMSRDMTIFIDDDDRAYHIYSSEENSTTHIAELTDDYTAHTGQFVRVFPGRFMEAPAICKHNGKYYFIASGCTGWAPNAARSAVADKLAGPWTELKNPCIGKDAHITFHGQSTYILPVQGKPGTFIFMADIWRPENAIDGRYMWLPMKWQGDQIILEWKDSWSLKDL